MSDRGLIRVYIAGPYTADAPDDVEANVIKAMDTWHELADAGYRPHCPHLYHWLHLHRQRPYEHWMANDFSWLHCCHVLYAAHGLSPGVMREIQEMSELGRPVFDEREMLDAWAERFEASAYAADKLMRHLLNTRRRYIDERWPVAVYHQRLAEAVAGAGVVAGQPLDP